MTARDQSILEATRMGSITVTDNTANPAPLGLLAFGLTTVLLNMHNAGFFALNAMILSMGIFYGGLAQIVAGIMEWRKNNTFGTTAFVSYGFFWLSLVGILLLPPLGLGEPPAAMAMAAYLGLWAIFTGVMFVATLRLNVALQWVFGTLTVLFLLLAIGDGTENAAIRVVAGYEGMVCGALAIYTGLAQVVNEVFGRNVAPLGAFKKSLKER